MRSQRFAASWSPRRFHLSAASVHIKAALPLCVLNIVSAERRMSSSFAKLSSLSLMEEQRTADFPRSLRNRAQRTEFSGQIGARL
jgi:hypothetical protein